MGQSKRILTQKELKRKENFEKLCFEMAQNGYKEKDLTLSILEANFAGVIIIFPFIVLIAWLYYTVNPITDFSFKHRMLFVFLSVCTIVIHELIHGITCAIFAQNHFKSIEFGIMIPMITPYCTCSQPLRKGHIIFGFAMPTLILGFGLATVSINLNSLFLFLLSEVNVIMGCGDFLAILKILFYHSKGQDVLYCVHPYKCGVVVFER